MDFSHYGLAAGLLPAIRNLRSTAIVHDTMLSHAVLLGENVCARLEVGEGREEIYLLPALDWILRAGPDENRRALVIATDAESASRAAAVARALGSLPGISLRILEEGEASPGAPEAEDSRYADGIARPETIGLIAESLVFGTLPAALAAVGSGRLSPGEFGFLVVDGLDAIAEKDGDRMESLRTGFLPPWELRAVFVCSRVTGKARKLVRDLAENVSEISIDEKFLRMRGIESETYHIDAGAKTAFILGLAARGAPESAIVFCNLADTAAELSRRLLANGLDATLMNGSHPAPRRRGPDGKAPGRGTSFFVACDDAAPRAGARLFPLVVNYDIPLDPELYGKRLAMLDPAKAGSKVVNLACERYVYGLSAIESLVGFPLNAVEVPAAMLSRPDASSSAPSNRGLPRSGEQRNDRRQRSDQGAEAAPRIMLSVDEAAGRMTAQTMRAESSLSGQAGNESARAASTRAAPSRAATSREAPEGKTARPEKGNRTARSESRPQTARPEAASRPEVASRPKAAEDRAEQKPKAAQARPADKSARPGRQARQTLPSERKKSVAGQAPRVPAQFRPGPVVDPYSLSMEERLQSYRERYIEHSSGEPARTPPSPSGNGRSGTVSGEGKRGGGRAAVPPPTRREPPSEPSSRALPELSSRALPEMPSPEPARESAREALSGEKPERNPAEQGGGAKLFGKIVNLFKKNQNIH